MFGVLAGVVIGIGLSLLWLISVTTRPTMPMLGREPGTQVFRELDDHPDDERFPGVVVLRLDGGLFFATSDALEDRIREVVLSTRGTDRPSCSTAPGSTSSTLKVRRRLGEIVDPGRARRRSICGSLG